MNASTSASDSGSTSHKVMDSPSIELGVDTDSAASNIVGQNNVVDSDYVLEPKHKVFLSHSGVQKDIVEQLCVDLHRLDRYPFFDKLQSSLPVGERFPKLIFEAIGQCQVGVLVLSKDFFMKTKWPMLELNAMVKEFEKPKSRMKIIPLFYHISLKDWKSLENRGLWISQWEEWARKDKRIDVEEWKKALIVLESINSLVMKEGMGDVKFREEIVKEICGMIPQETRWDDSHVQGGSRMCEVICKKMDEVSSSSIPCVVGLHGVGGIGKTTVCKALCNYLALKFHDHVCHVNFGQDNEMKMLQKALKMLTGMSHEILDKLEDMEQGYSYLKRRIQDVPVFLALDNVQDGPKSIQAARAYLRGSYGVGSVVLVTARTKDVLRKLNIEERHCLEMPELEESDARSLFLSSSGLSLETSIDEQIIRKSIQVCYLLKADGARRHYHPLALEVLGQQLGPNTETWEAALSKINKMNELQDGSVIFSILRSSFESLPQKHRLIFMDLALLRAPGMFSKCATFEWLCMVHEESAASMKNMLEVLRTRSITENPSDEFSSLDLHDLWREFAILESKAEDSKDPQWVYQVDGVRVIKYRGQPRESVERMVFVDEGWKSLKSLKRWKPLKLADFVNAKVFKLEVQRSVGVDCLQLDFSGLTSLKSLEVRTSEIGVVMHGLSSLTNLGYLHSSTGPQFLSGIGRLTALQVLELEYCEGVRVLDLTKLKLLRVVNLSNFPRLARVIGLSSTMVGLFIIECDMFRSCPGMGELSNLEELSFLGCKKLENLPWLGQLTRLRTLSIRNCSSIRTLRGLGDLVSLEALNAGKCSELAVLPGVAKLTKLQYLDLWGCPVQDVPGLGGLTALTTLCACFDKVQGELPDLSKLSKLISASIGGWNGQIWAIIQNMPMLETLSLWNCTGEDVVADLEGLNGLKVVDLHRCNFKVLSGLSSLATLDTLKVCRCKQLQRLPDFERLTNLRQLSIGGRLENVRDWSSVRSLCSLISLKIVHFPVTKIVFALEKFSGLRELTLLGSECESVLSMASVFEDVEYLTIKKFDTVEVLDPSNFPQLKSLHIIDCGALRSVTCSIRLPTLISLEIWDCQSVVELPDLSTFPQLQTLRVYRCNALTRLSCSSRLIALQVIDLFGHSREILPELTCFPNLNHLEYGEEGKPMRCFPSFLRLSLFL